MSNTIGITSSIMSRSSVRLLKVLEILKSKFPHVLGSLRDKHTVLAFSTKEVRRSFVCSLSWSACCLLLTDYGRSHLFYSRSSGVGTCSEKYTDRDRSCVPFKTAWQELEEVGPLVTGLLCKHEDLVLITESTHKETVLQPIAPQQQSSVQHQGGGHRQVPGAHWLDSLA